MILSLIKRVTLAYFNLIQDLFELVFGIKIFRMLMTIIRQIIRLIKFSFISFHIVILIYYFLYPQHVYKQLVFHKNEANNYFSYFLENSATQQICYQWKLYKNAIIEKEEGLSLLDLKVKREEKQLELFIQKSLKQEDLETDQNIIGQQKDDINLNVLQFQNNIKKYKSEYDEYKSNIMSFNEQKRKEMMWQSWIEMDLICNLNANQNLLDTANTPRKSMDTSNIILELQILNLSANPSSLKVIPLNILLIDKFNQKIPLKKDIIVQQEQSVKISYWEKVLRAVLSKCFNLLGVEFEDDVFEIKQEIEAVSKGSQINNEITGILISLENPSNKYLIQQARIEIIPAFKGLKYMIFHYFYATFMGLFIAIIVYLYIFTGIISYCCSFRKNKQKNE